MSIEKTNDGEAFRKPPRLISDWKLPKGVARTQWEYISSESVAKNYDHSLCGTPLLSQDLDFFLTHCDKPGLTLDLGCGTGRLARRISPLGYRTIGIDLSGPMLDEFQTKAGNDPASGIIRANMLDLSFLKDHVFEYVACLFSSFGMMLDPKDRLVMLQGVFRVLKPGGTLVLHVHNLWSACRGQGGIIWVVADLIKRLVGVPGFGNKLMPTHGAIHGLTLHLFSYWEISKLLKLVGFQMEVIKPLFEMNQDDLAPKFFKSLKAHGFMINAKKP